MNERYIVEPTKSPCKHCGAGGFWTVLDTDKDTHISTDFGDKEQAEYICERMNEAYNEGVEVGNQQGAGR